MSTYHRENAVDRQSGPPVTARPEVAAFARLVEAVQFSDRKGLKSATMALREHGYSVCLTAPTGTRWAR